MMHHENLEGHDLGKFLMEAGGLIDNDANQLIIGGQPQTSSQAPPLEILPPVGALNSANEAE